MGWIYFPSEVVFTVSCENISTYIKQKLVLIDGVFQGAPIDSD